MKTMIIGCLLLTGYWTVYGAEKLLRVHQPEVHETSTNQNYHEGKGNLVTSMGIWLADNLKFSDTSDIWIGFEIPAPASIRMVNEMPRGQETFQIANLPGQISYLKTTIPSMPSPRINLPSYLVPIWSPRQNIPDGFGVGINLRSIW